MNTPASPSEWMRTFLPLGRTRDDRWHPFRAGVLLVDMPVVWLVTTTRVVDAAGDDAIVAWVGTQQGAVPLDLTSIQRRAGYGWVHP